MKTKETVKISDFDIRRLLEQNGVQFVARSYGLTTTKTITLDCLLKVIKEAIKLNAS
jgi:hypothetical protein